jgi:hypothetical protein
MKWFDYLVENVWVWAGTGLVLITLSGQTRMLGFWITVAAVMSHLVITAMKGGDDE